MLRSIEDVKNNFNNSIANILNEQTNSFDYGIMQVSTAQECNEIFDGSKIQESLLLHLDFKGNIENSTEVNFINTNVSISQDRFSDLSAGQFGDERTLNFGNNPLLKPNFPMSFAFWVKQDEIGLNRNYIYTSDLQFDKRAGFAIAFGATNNKLSFFYSDENGCYNPACRRQITTVDPVASDDWVHLSIIVRGHDDSEFYVNGCEVPIVYSGSGALDLYYTDEPSYIGFADNANNPTSQRAYFGGSIDDFYFWNRSITEEEVMYLYDRFEVPEMGLNNVYTILEGQEDITIGVSNIFSNVEWSNGQNGNSSIFTEEGTYQVEALYDCHLVCFEFDVVKEPEIVDDCENNFSAENINDDLIVHFELNGDATDNSPFNSNGSISGVDGTTDRLGIVNSAMKFSSNEEISIPKEERFEIIFPFSISFWAYFETTGSTTQGGIFSSNLSQDDYTGIIVNRNAEGQISCQVGNGTGSISPASTKSMITVDEIPKDKWTHIVIRLNGSNSGQIFIDGCEVPVFYGGTGVWNIVYRDVPMKLGRSDTSSDSNVSENYLHGSLDDFYFWNRIISKEEILYLYDRFEVPNINIGDTDIECGELISIEVDNIFTDIVWSDGQEGNIGAFASDGSYSVQGLYNCIPVCSDFTISLESENTLDLQDTIHTCDTILILESTIDVLWEDGTFGSQLQVSESGLYKLFNICGEELDRVFVNMISVSNQIEEEYTICADEQIIISLPEVYDNILWSNGNSDNELSISEQGVYNVEYSFNDCSTKEIFTVEIQRCDRCEYYVPNIFSPNSISENDLFKIEANSIECIENSEINIFDRWGNRVYSENLNIPWDGLFNGKLVSEGVYVFHISGIIDEEIISQYGNITVVY